MTVQIIFIIYKLVGNNDSLTAMKVRSNASASAHDKPSKEICDSFNSKDQHPQMEGHVMSTILFTDLMVCRGSSKGSFILSANQG